MKKRYCYDDFDDFDDFDDGNNFYDEERDFTFDELVERDWEEAINDWFD